MIAAVSGGLFWLFSLPAMRLDAWGVRELGGRKIAWSRVATCRVEIQRDVFGDATKVSVRLLDLNQRKLALFSLAEFKKPQQQEFLLALHRALQPREEAPDMAQVLADDAKGPSST